MDKEKIERINFLAKESKLRALTDAEKEEQAALRAAYLREFRAALRGEAIDTDNKKI